MKKIIILFSLVFLLVGCGTKNENKNTNTNNNGVEVSEEEQANEILLHYEGRTNDYSAEVTISQFTDDDAELIKSEFGEDSDEYIMLQDNRPTYKVESFILYDGEGNVDLKEVTELKISISPMDINSIYFTEQDIVKVLQGKDNISHNYFIYEDLRNELPTEDTVIEMIGTFDGNSQLDFTVELNSI
ncbi:membrane lipoprotein lipid attachment site-containing protein [Anaerosphaera multitolerans]|uniref:Uncharacterized protein n=1 Tax=Anaerosphaera multitolerans TaxID=2487351 RepID=A0A437S736_9FIRM|nr:membrane lipoprotein lipid attachment site-containing protein [Anaerosphaera multitolerans]RVU54727.1 hypothetical protein EF514_06380 [Anaerosphaera multitolerans]